MPEICRFYGIVLKMYTDHAPPPFHAESAEHEARIAIQTQAVLTGSLPPRHGVVAEWAKLHQAES